MVLQLLHRYLLCLGPLRAAGPDVALNASQADLRVVGYRCAVELVDRREESWVCGLDCFRCLHVEFKVGYKLFERTY